MNRIQRKTAIAALTAIIGGGALLPFHMTTVSAAGAAPQSIVASFNLQVDQAIQHLVKKGVLQGYEDGKLRAEKDVTNAELVKMIVLTLGSAPEASESGKWYKKYVDKAVATGLITNEESIQPNQLADRGEAAAMIAKALQRDVNSVRYWMDGIGIGQTKLTRGEAAQLLVLSEQAIRKETAQIQSIKALNAITFEVTFDAPLTLADEETAAATENFAFDNGLKLNNQPRLKTGSIATYIVPVQTMKADTMYTLNYKGKQTFKVDSSSQKMKLNATRQVASDTFEVDSFRIDGVIDYGYLISAYAGGRGANAVVMGENNTLDGKPMQIISSLASRQAVLTPEGGEPMTVNYVGFTQSTDGKQEPKFRLPAGKTLQPGMKYSVSSDWFTLANDSFVAGTIEPLVIDSVSQADSATLNVTLKADPMDELFAYRSIQLKGSDGTTLTAQYKVQSRKGAIGIFEIQNGGKLAAGLSYEVTPVGSWATASGVSFTAN
ncbi:S-layer homology domain-containing protein [Paenibacillus radicis (ex Gao et al. 2016)]|uniref:SLH domain-containing protein n=1 Tax=Paenibacillus radicis (ex Gao et al. 2016) TaxID=1737354 RepID=A0A917H8U6_9BACL|nr:S-layer homology domain-containing protein [Paenibacillus radicis (ex Gao et al. 2016)]GGG70928.1 hypothetical protein GCM10010918_28010 [Paenibacillus radicis (ex Gao et al. 2016)]